MLKNVPVVLAAKFMDKCPQFVRIGLQRDLLPFGRAIKMSKQYTYYINPMQFCEYIGISMDDLNSEANEKSLS